MKFSEFLIEGRINFPLLEKYYSFEEIITFLPHIYESFKVLAITEKLSAGTFRKIKSMKLSVDATKLANDKQVEIPNIEETEILAYVHCQIASSGAVLLINDILLKVNHDGVYASSITSKTSTFIKNSNQSNPHLNLKQALTRRPVSKVDREKSAVPLFTDSRWLVYL